MDQELRWNQQVSYAMAKASKWILAFRHLAHPLNGVQSKLMHQLYNLVAVPKLTYAADVWYTPVCK